MLKTSHTNLPTSRIADSFRYAVMVTRSSRSNFHLAFRMLPRPMYEAMCAIYAFLRISDDLVDGAVEDPVMALKKWQEQIEHLPACLDQHRLFPALIQVLQQYQIPQAWLQEFLAGMEQDLRGERFSIWQDLVVYCDRVAGVPGLCCQSIWGADLAVTRELALECGRGFQLTNILRDLAEDACRGRCYLPADECERFGFDPTQIGDAEDSASTAELLEFQLERARQLYRNAAQLDHHLQGPGRRMFRIMYATYAELLQQIARSPTEVFRKRIRLSRSKKLKLLCTAAYSQPRMR